MALPYVRCTCGASGHVWLNGNGSVSIYNILPGIMPKHKLNVHRRQLLRALVRLEQLARAQTRLHEHKRDGHGATS